MWPEKKSFSIGIGLRDLNSNLRLDPPVFIQKLHLQ
jgi:hypothetical protein